MAKILACALVLLSSVGLAAQKTWIVDAKNGKGTHFTDIQPAVNAASDGDTIVVRAGNYGGFHANKSISILGVPGAIVNRGGANPFQALTISGLTADKVIRIYGLSIAVPIVYPSGPTISNCQGRVLLENVSFSGASHGLVVRKSKQVWLASCNLVGVLDIRDSRVTATDCSLFGTIRQLSQPGVYARSSNVTLSRCDVKGAPKLFFAASPGILATNATLMITSDGTGAITAGLGTAPVPAITGSGTLVLDPNVVLRSTNNSPPITGSIRVTRRTVPSLRTRNAALGGRLLVDLYSPAKGPFFLFVGLAIAPVDIPALGGGGVWIAPPLLAAQGVQNATGRFTLSVNVPNDSRLIGFVFAWQAYAGKDARSLYLSNASAYVHR